MFRKPVNVAASSPLRTSEKRKLRADVTQQYPLLGTEVLDILLPLKGTINLVRVAAPSRVSIYTSASFPKPGDTGALDDDSPDDARYGQPLFFTDGSSTLLPTLYSLWLAARYNRDAPQYICPIMVTHSEVSTFLLKGADLMMPGVYRPLDPALRPGQVGAVYVRGNPMPVAVGVSMVDAHETSSHGKALEVKHIFKDELWSLGSKWIPDRGFGAAKIEPAMSESHPNLSTTGDETAESGEGESLATDLNLNQITVTTGEPSQTSSAPGDVDLLLKQCFLQACKTTGKKDSVFPLEASKFFNDHVLAARPDKSVKLDIKSSSYKKVGMFLKAMDKEGLCKVKEVHGQLQVLRILRHHREYKNFRPARRDEDAASDAGSNAEEESADIAKSATIKEVYRFSAKMRPVAQQVFEKQSRIGSENYGAKDYFDEEGLRGVLEAYISLNQLFRNAPRDARCHEPYVSLDPLLTDALFANKSSKEGSSYPETVALGEARKMFVSNAEVYHEVRGPGRLDDVVVKRGRIRPVTIILEDRQGGRKHVTRASGFEPFRIDPREIASYCQTKFACSVSVSELPGKTKAVGQPLFEIHIQGDFMVEMRDTLIKTYCVAAAHIDLIDRTKEGKKAAKRIPKP